MSWIKVPQNIGPPCILEVCITAGSVACAFPPASGGLSLSEETLGPLDLTTVGGAALFVRQPDGTTTTWSASYVAPSEIDVTGVTAATPIEVTMGSGTLIGPTVTISDVDGVPEANGEFWYLQRSADTIALYADPQFQEPVVGSGAYVSGGVVAENTQASITYPFVGTEFAQGPGIYVLQPLLDVDGGTVPCSVGTLLVTSPFAASSP